MKRNSERVVFANLEVIIKNLCQGDLMNTAPIPLNTAPLFWDVFVKPVIYLPNKESICVDSAMSEEWEGRLKKGLRAILRKELTTPGLFKVWHQLKNLQQLY